MTTYYVGMDVHQASIVIAVTNAVGKVVMESIIETKAQTVRDFIKGLRGGSVAKNISATNCCRGEAGATTTHWVVGNFLQHYP